MTRPDGSAPVKVQVLTVALVLSFLAPGCGQSLRAPGASAPLPGPGP